MTPLLVDSSIYIDFLRCGTDIRLHLVSPLRQGILYNTGIIRAEVIRGMKSPKTRDGMNEFFDIVPEIPADARLWQHVSDLGWRLGRSGKWPPITDIAIAAAALRIKATLITTDRHFDDIPDLLIREDLPE